MLFAVLFTDRPDHGPLRAEFLKAHIEWVSKNKDAVLVAGSLRREPNEVPKGGLWVVQADSKQIVLELLKTDPFYSCGLRESVEILYWSKALQDHKALV